MRSYSYPKGLLSPLEAAILTILLHRGKRGSTELKQDLEEDHSIQILAQSLYVVVQRLRDNEFILTSEANDFNTKPHDITKAGKQALY